MVQSLGISVGNLNSYVAAGQGGGIEILLNEYSNRSTPSMVAFTDHSRSIGVDASSNYFMNLKNTINDLMILLGKPYKELKLIDENTGRPIYPFTIEEAPNGQAKVLVRHLGEERKFTITQIVAMLLTKLRGIAGSATDCVLSCPQFYTEQQRYALFQAALVAGLNPLQIITEMAAVVLNYAHYRTTKDDAHRFVAFINFGQSNLQCVVAWMTPKEDLVRILAAESEPIGGRDFDRLLADHFIKESNLNLSPKAYLKLVSACEKLKRMLSANSNETPIHVESLISEDKDFTSRTDRAAFEKMSSHLFERVERCLQRALDNSKTVFNQMLGNFAESAKATEVARAAEAAKASELSKQADAAKAVRQVEAAKATEANLKRRAAEEAAAKAAAEEAAAKAASGQEQPEQSSEKPAGDQSEPEAQDQVNGEAAKNDQHQPTTTTENKQASEAAPMDAEPEELTKAKAEETRLVQAAKAAKSAEKSLASQLNKLNKLADLKFELQVVEMVGGSTRMPMFKQIVQNVFKLTPSTTLNTDEAVARGCVLHCATLHPGMKVKREVKIMNAEPFSRPSGLTCDTDLRRIELELINTDRKYMSRTEARNNLEEFIYAERAKLQEGDKYLEQLSEALDWLFSDDGEEATEDDYNKKLKELKKVAEARLTQNQPAEGDQKQSETSDSKAAEANDVEMAKE